MSIPESALSEQNKAQVIQILLKEYDALKSEQRARIGFRDGLLYTTIAVVGAIASVAMGGFGNKGEPVHHALLLIPWVTTILGWTYLVNDQKITAIRRHVDTSLSAVIRTHMGIEASVNLFPWEPAHRGDRRRKRRKGIQVAVDLWTFVVSGLLAIVTFWLRATNKSWYHIGLAILDGAILSVLAWQIVDYWWDASHDDPNNEKGTA